MNRSIVLTLIGLLTIAPVITVATTIGVQAKTVDSRKVEADRLLRQGLQQYETRQFEAAIQSWQQSLNLYREIKNRPGEGAVLGILGFSHYLLGNYPKAIELQEQSLAIARETKDRGGEADALNILGKAINHSTIIQKRSNFRNNV